LRALKTVVEQFRGRAPASVRKTRYLEGLRYS